MSISPTPTTLPETGPSHPLRTYGLMALLGAAAMGAGAFAPWLTSDPGSLSLTGWDISKAATGSQQWYIGDMFAAGSPFFPGYTVVAMAVLFGLAGVGLVVTLRTLGRTTRLLMVILPLVALTVVALNLYSIFLTQDPKVVDLGWGLIATMAGAWLAAIAIAFPGSRRTRIDALRKPPRAGGNA